MEADHYEAVAAIIHHYDNGRITESDAIQQLRNLLHQHQDNEKPE